MNIFSRAFGIIFAILLLTLSIHLNNFTANADQPGSQSTPYPVYAGWQGQGYYNFVAYNHETELITSVCQLNDVAKQVTGNSLGPPYDQNQIAACNPPTSGNTGIQSSPYPSGPVGQNAPSLSSSYAVIFSGSTQPTYGNMANYQRVVVIGNNAYTMGDASDNYVASNNISLVNGGTDQNTYVNSKSLHFLCCNDQAILILQSQSNQNTGNINSPPPPPPVPTTSSQPGSISSESSNGQTSPIQPSSLPSSQSGIMTQLPSISGQTCNPVDPNMPTSCNEITKVTNTAPHFTNPCNNNPGGCLSAIPQNQIVHVFIHINTDAQSRLMFTGWTIAFHGETKPLDSNYMADFSAPKGTYNFDLTATANAAEVNGQPLQLVYHYHIDVLNNEVVSYDAPPGYVIQSCIDKNMNLFNFCVQGGEGVGDTLTNPKLQVLSSIDNAITTAIDLHDNAIDIVRGYFDSQTEGIVNEVIQSSSAAIQSHAAEIAAIESRLP